VAGEEGRRRDSGRADEARSTSTGVRTYARAYAETRQRTCAGTRRNERQTARLNDGGTAERQAGRHGGEAASIEQGHRDC